MATYSNEAHGAIDLLVALGMGALPVVVQIIDGNSEIVLSTLARADATRALKALGFVQLRAKADAGMLEVCFCEGTLYFNLYL